MELYLEATNEQVYMSAKYILTVPQDLFDMYVNIDSGDGLLPKCKAGKTLKTVITWTA